MSRKEEIEKLFEGCTPDYLLPKIRPYFDQNFYLVGGELKKWDGHVTEVFSPICYEKGSRISIGYYPDQGPEESKTALEAAVTAYNQGMGTWPTMSLAKRIECLQIFVKLMKEKRDEVVRLLMWEICKSATDSYKEFDRTVEYIEKTIEAAKNIDHDASKLQIEEGIIAQIRRAPLGVVLCLAPFNYPLNELYTTMIPALLMGNTIIFKPARYGILLHAPLLEAFKKAFPPGVVNTIYGDGKVIIGPLMSSGKIDVLAFIGTSKVANILKHQHPYPNRLRCVLGLDAKNPCVIMEDADIDLAVKECVLGSLSFNGQRCTALKIIFVHKSILEQFTAKFSEAVEKLTVGLTGTPYVMITPLAEEGKVEWLNGLIKDAQDKGASILNPSGGISNKTFFFPAVVYPVTPEMRLYREEQFGPIVPIASFENPSEVLQYVIESNFGQQISIFGNDPALIADLIDPLSTQVSRININCQCQRGPDSYPFTGRKDSAEGTLSIMDALKVFSIRAMVAAKVTDPNKAIITKILTNRQSQFLSRDFIL
jgi:glyceraldehyde-3-phosphate dehydrogenase (NADP+)